MNENSNLLEHLFRNNGEQYLSPKIDKSDLISKFKTNFENKINEHNEKLKEIEFCDNNYDNRIGSIIFGHFPFFQNFTKLLSSFCFLPLFLEIKVILESINRNEGSNVKLFSKSFRNSKMGLIGFIGVKFHENSFF